MISNYYQTLSLTPQASPQQIAEQYRKLAHRHHPNSTTQNPKVAEHTFHALAEAYEVLSDPLKRAFYDKYGHEALQQGLYAQGQLKGGYRYSHNPQQIYNNFFKKHESLDRVLDLQVNNEGSLFGHAFGGLQHKNHNFSQNLIVKVPCTIEELYKGRYKIVQYQRKILNSDGRTTTVVNTSKKINIKPGYGEKTVLYFPGEGHQTVHRNTSDLHLCICQLPHPFYTRSGDDLIYTYPLQLADALSCSSISLNTPDDRLISVGIDSIVSPRNLQQVQGEGFPNPQTSVRGCLLIKFDIAFPIQLSQTKRVQLRELLSG